MFDIAWSELFLILIVALVVVGPKDLPRLMRSVGQWAGRARAMADQFRRSFDDMARQTELDELRTEVNRLKSEVTAPMTDLDYEALGIPMNPMLPPIDPSQSAIEDVGAAPPKFDEPAPSSVAQVALPDIPPGEIEPGAAPAEPKTI